MKKMTILFIFSMICGLTSCFNAEKLSNANQVGKQIKTARIQQGISQKTLADTLNLTTEKIEIIEKGKAVPTRDIMSHIEQYLKIEIMVDQ